MPIQEPRQPPASSPQHQERLSPLLGVSRQELFGAPPDTREAVAS